MHAAGRGATLQQTLCQKQVAVTKREKALKHSGEIQQICDPERKLGQGNDNSKLQGKLEGLAILPSVSKFPYWFERHFFFHPLDKDWIFIIRWTVPLTCNRWQYHDWASKRSSDAFLLHGLRNTSCCTFICILHSVQLFFVESGHMAAKLFSALTFRHTDKAAPQETRIIHAELLVITLAI